MRRQGWAFGLGLLVSGAALAQPPANSERYPPAPDLPGVVVGQTQNSRPVGKVVVSGGQGEKQILAEPAPVPRDIEKAPETVLPVPETVTSEPATPTESEQVQASCPRPTQGLGLGTGKHLDCVHRLQAWLCFRSRARQSGHYVTPYYYPLQAWFPCEPRRPVCGSCVSVPPSGKHHHGIAMPGYEAISPGPVVIPPTIEKSVPPENPPVSPTPKLMPKSGVTLPLPVPPPAPSVDGDLPPGFKRVDVGLSFTPGVAPISKPTTQTDRVSNWRPK